MLIADKIIQMIEENVGVTFNHKLVRFGSCLPDLQPFRRMQIHVPRIVPIHVEKEYARIADHEKTIERISMIIGLLSHYVADAFCLAHNIYMVDMKKHVQYEFLLDKKKHYIEFPTNMVQVVEEQIHSLQNGIYNIEEYFGKMNKTYLDRVQGLSWDEAMRIDMEQSVVHGASLLTHFILELQNIQVPALCIA